MPFHFARIGCGNLGGADPLVRGRRPRRPAGTLQGADIVGPAAGRGRPARTRGSAPPFVQNGLRDPTQWHWGRNAGAVPSPTGRPQPSTVFDGNAALALEGVTDRKSTRLN